jgi:hypothetical protein
VSSSTNEKWLLGGAPLPEPPRVLRAGPVEALFEPGSGFLRFVRHGEAEILRGLYAAVRNHNWDTVVPEIADLAIEEGDGTFHVTFNARCQGLGVDFRWRGELTGETSGAITYAFRGEALSDLRANRIGFCVLHPAGPLGGRGCSIEGVDGTVQEGTFPDLISPHQPYFGIRAIRHELEPGLSAEVRMTGDTFEMEDQRNWTDATYKTYCRPLAEPWPFPVAAGETVEQTIAISLIGSPRAPAVTGGPTTTTTIAWTDAARPLPPIGLGVASHGEALSEGETARLRALRPGHLRVDLDLEASGWKGRLEQAAREASALESALELALHLGETAEPALQELGDRLGSLGCPVPRVLVFQKGEMSTPAQSGQLAREALGPALPGVPFALGTDAFFAEVNRSRPDPDVADLVCFSVNPQVHAFDELSMVETLEAQSTAVQTALSFPAGRPVTVSPVTLRMRFNPNATGPEPEPGPGELPPQVDPRQMSLFAAAWTLGSVRALIAGGAASATFFETTGWRGVMEREAGPALPERLPSEPSTAFPVYHVLADVCRDPGAEALLLESSNPLAVQALALRHEGRHRVLVANMEPREQGVQVTLPRAEYAGRLLDLESVATAAADPAAFRETTPLTVDASDSGEARLRLGPWAILTLEELA